MRHSRFAAFGSHVTGGIVGGAVLGAVLALAVKLTSGHAVARLVIAVLIATLVLCLSLTRLAPIRGVGLSWQVPRGRRLRLLDRNTILALWGGLLGVGGLTVVPHAVVLLLPASAIAASQPVPAIAAGCLYGGTRAVLAGVVSMRPGADPGTIIDTLEPQRRRLTRRSRIVAPVASVGVVLLAATSNGWLG